MEQCLLCKTKPADKKGSHIIPLFIVQTMINADGIKGRNKQVSIEIGTLSTGLYFGREVSLEKVNKVLGREMSDDEIESQSDPLVLDNVFCSECEKRLSLVESHYSTLSSVQAKLRDDICISKCDAKSALLFWASVIWRISASGIAGFSLEHEEEKLRTILDETLPYNAKELEEKISESEILDSIGYCLAYCPDHADPTSRLFIADPVLKHPGCMIINQYVLFFNPKGDFKELAENSFFGFEKFNRKNSFNPMSNIKEVISIISEEEFTTMTKRIFKYKAKIFHERIQQYCHFIYLHFFKMPMPQPLLKTILDRIILKNSELTNSNRYKMERMSMIVGEEIIKMRNGN